MKLPNFSYDKTLHMIFFFTTGEEKLSKLFYHKAFTNQPSHIRYIIWYLVYRLFNKNVTILDNVRHPDKAPIPHSFSPC